jgi:hypothetical protein
MSVRLRMILVALSCCVLVGAAQQQDVIHSQRVASGVTHTSYDKPGPYSLHVLELDLREPNVRLESFHMTKLVRTSTQSSANERAGHHVVGVINADFFSFQTGWPVGNQVMNGKVIHGSPSLRSHIGFTRDGKPQIGQFSFRGSVTLKSGACLSIDRVNERRANDRTILYTSEWDTALTVKAADNVLVSRIIGGQWRTGETMKAVVASFGVYADTSISYDASALLVSDAKVIRATAGQVRKGDTVSVLLDFEPHIGGLTEVLGGGGRILENGVFDSTKAMSSEKLASDFLTRRHPRTFVGFDRDTTRLFLCVVDGRQESSIGMNFQEMADFLRSIGAWNAVNLDGGGSTTMVVAGVIVNSPSDKTGERPVANTLQVITTKRQE